MRIVVIGATGRTGRAVVEQALGHGDEVVAFARQPERLELSHPRLTLAPGDVRELDSLRAALVGAEGVVSVIGAASGREVDTYSVGVGNIMQAMVESGVPRLAVMSASGTFHRSSRNLTVGYRMMMKATLGGLYDDLERMEQRIMASQLEWTIVRAAGLTDGEFTGVYRIGDHGKPLANGQRISRADVAALLLKSLYTDRWLRRAVTVAY